MGFFLLIIFESRNMPYGAVNRPGPSFLPFWVSIFGFIVAACITLTEYELNPKRYAIGLKFAKVSLTAIWKQKILIYVALLFVHTIIFRYINVYLAHFTIALLLIKVNEYKGWVIPISASVLLTFLLWLVFTYWLGVPYPRTIFG